MGAQVAELPRLVAPALAQLTRRAPTGDGWLHEIKFDGYRLLARLENGKVQLRTRRGNNWTVRFPELGAAISVLPAENCGTRWRGRRAYPSGVTSFLRPSRCIEPQAHECAGLLRFRPDSLRRL